MLLSPMVKRGFHPLVIRVLWDVDGKAWSQVKHEIKIGMIPQNCASVFSERETQAKYSSSRMFKTRSVLDFRVFFFFFLQILEYLHIHDIITLSMKEKPTPVSST